MTKQPRRATLRISWALMISIGVAVILAGISSGWFVYSLAKSTLIREGIQEIVTTSKTSALKLMEENHQHPTRVPVEDLNDLATGHLYFLLLTPHGQFIGSSGPMPPGVPRQGWANAGVSGWFNVNGTPYVFANTPLILDNRHRNLIVVDGLTRTASLLSTLRTALVFGELLLVMSSILAVIIIVRQVTEPLRSLEEVAGTVTLNRKTGQHVVIPSNLTEVVSLTESFNSMLDRLLKAQERERQFISNAAHSLRTPIHIIRGYIHTLTQWAQNDPQSRSQALKALARESQAMETLVNRLLQLSRMEQEDPPPLHPLEVVPYLQKILPNLRDTCLHHPLTLDLTAQAIPDILSEPDLLEAVLRILVENADTYADDNTTVTLFVIPLTTTRRVRIGVLNQGPGISKDTLAHLFDRFYRAAQPASSHHFGLGLAIANSIVLRIRGHWVIESESHRTIFAIDLPMS
ncbi:sensor histidine kinase [Sulfobacillus thermosulfidooxidans]|uniref:sensor histidine kinase n=1 Tax=Sulfobacillus thermosulfidooxidans TaxID=28034 RepID=UPI0006B48D5D|nr:HAMP domain-containing sensor histidine kinase [Sulfobacillus thermosulfidooxidans]